MGVARQPRPKTTAASAMRRIRILPSSAGLTRLVGSWSVDRLAKAINKLAAQRSLKAALLGLLTHLNRETMSAFLATMRDGRWLTRERIRVWALAVLAASVIGFVFLI